MTDEMKAPVYSEDVLRLMNMADDMVYAKDIAKVVGMRPDVIIKKAKSGEWPREICNYVVSGNSVKFFRMDLLRKGGWIRGEQDGSIGLADLAAGVTMVLRAQERMLGLLEKIGENQVLQSRFVKTLTDTMIMAATKTAGSGN